MPLPIYLRGLGLSASLIVAIGAQNAFVLRQGLRRHYVLLTAAVCILCDAVMFTIGAAGFGSLVASFPALTALAAWGGAIFLLAYGAAAFRAAYRGAHLEVEAGAPALDRRAIILAALGVSVLNPHAWLDTVVLAGGIAGQYPWGERIFFLLGTISASFTWFLLLAYGAGLLVPLFRKPAAWRMLDAGIGLLMWGIALGLLRGQIGV